MDTKKTQNKFSVVKIPIDAKIIDLARQERKRGDLIEISKMAYGTSQYSNRVFYALLTGRAEQQLAESIEKYYKTETV